MNIALIGNGKMGKEVERVAKEKGMKIVAVFTRENNAGGLGITTDGLKHVDVCIDFSTPTTVIDNIEAVAECGKSIVVGTTGWYDRLEQVKKLVKEKKIGFLYASNFSLGVNIFSQVVTDASRLFDKYSDYDVSIHEVHHKGKADSPSGTALSLGSAVLHSSKRKTEILHETSHGQIKPHQLHITSTRVGHVTGTHTVLFDSESDSIELVHRAKNRRGFALGAVVAAEWLKGKKGFYTMRDVILP
ncbi:MAG: 4-hydroxy-tetrahydrodipicolinate reductase [Bacteroidetes bacterium]|nr:4-hydroxy-tetrahydrodipicolinate reductase [Bacteroidota bacterium]